MSAYRSLRHLLAGGPYLQATPKGNSHTQDNGATIKDILSAFAREYFWLLSLAAIMAFPVGYAVMKHWLESYVVQTAISGWIFVSIYAGAALVIAVSIGWRVWRAANENPAEVIKNE